MPTTFKRLITGVCAHWHQRWIEWSLGWLLMAQGAWLALKVPIEPNRVYALTLSMLQEPTLGAIALTIGVVWVCALFLNGTFMYFRRLSPWVRALAAISAMVYWSFWSITLQRSEVYHNVFSLSWINHAWLAFMAFMCLMSLADEVAAADKKANVWHRQRKIGTR